MVNQATYNEYQRQLASSKALRYFWQFWGNYAFVFFVIAILYILSNPVLKEYSRPAFILSIVAFIIGRGVLASSIALILERKRPYQEFGFEPIVSNFFSIKTRRPNSFPSGHITAFFAVATVVCLFYPPLGAGLVAVSMVAAIARVVLGFHWPSDVIVGGLLGTLTGYLVVMIGLPMLFT